MVNLSFYKNKTVLVTGHTGFKGTWLCKVLINAGAKVVGYSLGRPTEPSLFDISNIEKNMISIMGDIRDFNALFEVFKEYQPQCVFHLAAQPIVRESYKNPRYTYETNIMGTVNLLECVRQTKSVKSVLNVTTDKVYENNDIDGYAFLETDPLDGYDPYSNSKSCSELVTHCYNKSFFYNSGICVSTARAGNVIGGGDFASDRIIPDCVRAIKNNTTMEIRNPYSTRPYQHVLEPISVYLEIVERQYGDSAICGYYNVGPDLSDCVTTGRLVEMFCKAWGEGMSYTIVANDGPHEASFLQLNNMKLKKALNWHPKWHIDETVKKVVEWTKVYLFNHEHIVDEMDKEIKEFFE